MELPRFVVIKSNYNGKYLRYINEEGEVHGLLQFSGEEAISPLVKFEVRPAKIGKGLVHIRSCYNNKYWVRWSDHHWWIAAGATEPVEDQSKWSCTLFKPIYKDRDAKTVQICHVQLQQYACLWPIDQPYTACLYAAGAEQYRDQSWEVHTIIDWETLLILPKHIAFKGDNGSYLSARWIEGHPYLDFASSDIGDPTVGNEIFTTSDGSIRIKSNYHGKFWRRSPNWIWADSDDYSSNNSDTLFWPVKVVNNVVALRNLGNKYFCKRLTTEGKTDCLNAAVPTITTEARLLVEELVISRSIYNVNFRLMDARIYKESVIEMDTQTANNETQEVDTMTLKFTRTETVSRTWSNSISVKLGAKTTLECGIPFISDGKIEISAEFSDTYQWGETLTSTTTRDTTYTTTVPPMTSKAVSLLATQGLCDVPFSYSQRDTLTNGDVVTYNKDDGLYIGMNCYNFRYHSKPTT